MRRKQIVYLLLVLFLLVSCAPPSAPAEDPGLIYTLVASTQTAAAWQTQMAVSAFTKTPTQATLRPTLTPFPTMTSFVYEVTPSLTPTATATYTPTKPVLTSWPDWQAGDVVTMEKGSGENIGTNKYFSILDGVQVIIIKNNGVKLRAAPNKGLDGPLEPTGSALTLTGIMNKNNEYGWLFAQVKAANGRIYWVGGTEGEDTDPRQSFRFYYPFLTTSPTLPPTDTPTPSRTPKATLTETPDPNATATP